MTSIYRTILSVTLCFGLTACFSFEDSTDNAPDETEDAGTGGGDVATPDPDVSTGGDDGSTQLDVADDAAAQPPTAIACDDATELELTYTPFGCTDPVEHRAGTTNILPSCTDMGDAAQPDDVHLNFPSSDGSTSMAISWKTGAQTFVSAVEYGTDPDSLDQVMHGHSFTYRELGDRRIHEVHLCGLEPGTTYYYRAGGEGVWSDVYSFVTAPALDSTDEFVFAVTGDTRSDDFELWGQAIEQMHEKGAEFIVFSGDAVDAGTVQSQWDGWFDAGGDYIAELPYLPCNGNHDLFTINYTAQFALPRDEDNFFVRYGNALFISLDDFPLHDLTAITGSTKEFLDETLAAHQDVPWKFILNHRPFYSASTRHGSSTDLQADWMPILDRYAVDMVFNGHDHNYERSRPIRNNEVVPMGRGTIYVVAAGVGAPMYDNGSQWWTHISEKVPSYAIVRVSDNELEFTAYRLDGTELDSFTWTK